MQVYIVRWMSAGEVAPRTPDWVEKWAREPPTERDIAVLELLEGTRIERFPRTPPMWATPTVLRSSTPRPSKAPKLRKTMRFNPYVYAWVQLHLESIGAYRH